ncbi:MAG TPA: methionine--tRNA ligase subunit beta [Patescibacteria group bacterium]
MDKISYEEFSKVEFKTGQIIEAKAVEGSEKLIRMVVDFGKDGTKIVFSGIKRWYSPEELVNKKTVFVTNVMPKKIMGEESEAMIFGAEDENTMSLLLPEKDIEKGSPVF